MEPEYPGNLEAGLSRCRQMLDDLASIGDEGRQAACGPCFAVCLNDASNACLRWLVIEKDATASIYLDVDESGGQNRIWRKSDRCVRLCRCEGDALNPAVRNPDRPRPAHGGSIKDLR